MLTTYDPRFAHHVGGLCFYSPPGDDDDKDDDDDDDKGKGGGGGGKDDDDKDWKAEAEKWRRLSRQHEGVAKANKTAAEKLAELENATKSDTEKLTARADEAERKLAAAEANLLRVRVALKKGLTDAQARRLVGDTEDELEADADELLETFGGGAGENRNERNERNGGNGDNPRRPRENLRPGAKPQTPPDKPEDLDPLKLAEAVPRGL